MENFQVIERIPDVEEYNTLKKMVGWDILDDDSITARGLNNSLYTVCVEHKGLLIAMGRVIGDNGIYFHIQDVIVDPLHQGKGLGKAIMKKLMDYVNDKAAKYSMVGLMCAKDKEPFYHNLGFVSRPSNIYGAGMMMVL